MKVVYKVVCRVTSKVADRVTSRSVKGDPKVRWYLTVGGDLDEDVMLLIR